MESSDPIGECKPPWLRVRLAGGEGFQRTLRVAREKRLHTVCEGARCPNLAECWGRGTATFMILGNVCTRGCAFCGVPSGSPPELDPDEPRRTAEAVRVLGIRHAVITSVTRDDLEDGGAGSFAETVRQIRTLCPGTTVELLTPDFQGRRASLEKIWEVRPDVFGHNVECVPRLQGKVRRGASYDRSRSVLEESRRQGLVVKTGLQVGHGETWEELLEVFEDLARVGVEILTIGQYLRPAPDRLRVERYYSPEEFARLEAEAKARGIPKVFSGPLVRSSYRAEEGFGRLPRRGESPVPGTIDAP